MVGDDQMLVFMSLLWTATLVPL